MAGRLGLTQLPQWLPADCRPLDRPERQRNSSQTLPWPLRSNEFDCHPDHTRRASNCRTFHSPRRKSPLAVLKTPMPCCLPSYHAQHPLISHSLPVAHVFPTIRPGEDAMAVLLVVQVGADIPASCTYPIKRATGALPAISPGESSGATHPATKIHKGTDRATPVVGPLASVNSSVIPEVPQKGPITKPQRARPRAMDLIVLKLPLIPHDSPYFHSTLGHEEPSGQVNAPCPCFLPARYCPSKRELSASRTRNLDYFKAGTHSSTACPSF